MIRRFAALTITTVLCAVPAAAQTPPPLPAHPISASVIGGMSAGHAESGLSVGGTFALQITERIAVEARGLSLDAGRGESGLEASGTMLFTLARTIRASPYAAVGGGIYRGRFDLDNHRFGDGMEHDMLDLSRSTARFYADRLEAEMMHSGGRRGRHAFIDPALTVGGGLQIDLTKRLYLRPDLRGLVVFSGGNTMPLVTMNVGFGVRF